MAARHPYITTIGSLTNLLDHLKKSFTSPLNADALKKLAIAPGNEGILINVVRFLGLIDDQNAPTTTAKKVFTLHDPEEFQQQFSDIVRAAYSELFRLYGDDAWTLEQSKLITFFRQSDQSTARVGQEQARTFKALAAYAGHGESASQARTRSTVQPPKSRASRKSKEEQPTKPSPVLSDKSAEENPIAIPNSRNFGLTVRVEINLPVTNEQEIYDKIFKSIRENLLNG